MPSGTIKPYYNFYLIGVLYFIKVPLDQLQQAFKNRLLGVPFINYITQNNDKRI